MPNFQTNKIHIYHISLNLKMRFFNNKKRLIIKNKITKAIKILNNKLFKYT